MTARAAAPLCAMAAALLLLPGCATPGRSTRQTVQVETPGCARASCELSNDLGHWALAQTPGSVSLLTSARPLRVACRTPQGHASESSAPASAPTADHGAVAGGVAGGAATGAMLGGAALSFIPVLGVLALATGAAVGAVAGQAVDAGLQDFTYPSPIRVALRCGVDDGAAAKPPPLGLGVRGLSPSQRQALGWNGGTGVQVTTVRPGGPAAAAGLQPDDLLLEAEGQPLNDAADLEELLRTLPPAGVLRLRVWRDGRSLELSLQRPPDAP